MRACTDDHVHVPLTGNGEDCGVPDSPSSNLMLLLLPTGAQRL